MLKFCFKDYKPTNVVIRSATPVDSFHFDVCTPAYGGSDAVIVSNPLYVIFNAQRLQSLGEFPLQEWIDAMNRSQSDSLKELRSKVSDEDLVNYMKSRYCQQPSELAQWASYLASNIDKLAKHVQEYVASQQQSAETEQVEQTKTE